MFHSFGGFNCSNMKTYRLAVWQFPFQPKEWQTGFDFEIGRIKNKAFINLLRENIPAYAIVVSPGRKDMSQAVCNLIRAV